MTELTIYDTMVLLFGEPTNLVGLVLVYIFAFIFVMLLSVWGLTVTLLVIRRILR